MQNEHFAKTVERIAIEKMNEGENPFLYNGHLDLSAGAGGGYFNGYGLINGTNSEYGGFALSGTVYNVPRENRQRVEAEYVIHDYVDANFSYGPAERLLWALCKVNTLGFGANDYELEIRGNIEFYVTWTMPE
ncbi:MAG: hypothetical protein RR296_11620 [Clostridia bacterium]